MIDGRSVASGGRFRLPLSCLGLAAIALSAALDASAFGQDSGRTAEWPASVPRGIRAAAEAAPDSAEAVLSRFLAAHSALRYDEALVYAEELIVAAPDHALAHYNLACVHARRHDVDLALEALATSVDRGWRNAAHASLDPDLAALRRQPEFRAALQRMRTLERQERLQPRPLRRESIDVIQRDVESGAPAVLERYHVPGAALAVVRDGQPIWQAGFGVSNRETGECIHGDTTWILDAPIDLLALVATAQLDEAERLDLPRLLLAAQERIETAVLATRALPGIDRGVRGQTVGFRPRRAGAERRLAPQFDDRAGDEAREVLFAGLDLAGSGFTAHTRRHVVARLHLARTRIGPVEPLPGPLGSGHTALGTPMPGPDTLRADSVITSAGDLAVLAAALSTPEEGGPLGDGVARGVTAAAEFGVDRLGLALTERETGGGRCLEITDAVAGVTLLMRWFPASGDAVVVIANSADAGAAVERLAQMAIGG